jgi:hypothetical protein
MLSAAKHLSAGRDRPFAAAQGDRVGVNGVTVSGPVHHPDYVLKVHSRPALDISISGLYRQTGGYTIY